MDSCFHESKIDRLGPLFQLWYGETPDRSAAPRPELSLTYPSKAQSAGGDNATKTNKVSKLFSHLEPLHGYTIVLNPGHGGDDSGATYGGIKEKDLTFALAVQVRKDLSANGAKVVMTRTTDIDMELADIDAVTRKTMPNAFLSIHFNASPNHSVRGTTAYYWYPESKPYAAKMLQSLVREVPALKSNGVLRNNYYVIDHTEVPAMLMEVTFISNDHDRALASDPSLRKRIAKAFADGEAAFLKPIKAASAKRLRPFAKICGK